MGNSNINDFIGFVIAFVIFVAESNVYVEIRDRWNRRKKNNNPPDAKS